MNFRTARLSSLGGGFIFPALVLSPFAQVKTRARWVLSSGKDSPVRGKLFLCREGRTASSSWMTLCFFSPPPENFLVDAPRAERPFFLPGNLPSVIDAVPFQFKR